MIMRSASSLDLNLRAAQKPSVVPRVVTTARPVSASPRVAKSITRASSDGNLYKIQSPENSRAKTISVYHEETASYKVLDGSRLLPQGGSNGGFGGPRGGDGAGGGGEGGSGGVDSYYEDMIQRYPGDTLLLSNYARFLKEVKGDGRKAEEYCERAMLSENGRDGEMLSMYGDLIWQNHGDGVRAHSYFDQAVQSSPDDCHVLASYARFLWDAEEEDEEEEESKHDSAFSTYNNNPSVSVVS